MEEQKSGKILIVDDEEVVCDFLSRFLGKEGYEEIETAETGEEALEKIKKSPPKLVLLDIRLPGMDGVETLEKIKEFNKDIGVIMITGFPDIQIAKEAMAKGAYDYIVKPFDLAYLKLSVLTKVVLSL